MDASKSQNLMTVNKMNSWSNCAY